MTRMCESCEQVPAVVLIHNTLVCGACAYVAYLNGDWNGALEAPEVYA